MPDFTVTVAGFERHDGASPFTYVTTATDQDAAIAAVLALHKADVGSNDVIVVSAAPGVPAADCGFNWNDLRGGIGRLLAGLAASTHVLVQDLNEDNGGILIVPKCDWERWKAIAKAAHAAGRRDGNWELPDAMAGAINAAKSAAPEITRYINSGPEWCLGDQTDDVVYGPGVLESMSEDPGDDRVWYRQIHPTSWVAYRGNQAIAEDIDEAALRGRLHHLGIEDYQHQPLRIVRI